MKLFAVAGKTALAKAINEHFKANDSALTYDLGPAGTELLSGRPTMAREGIRFDYIDEDHRSGQVKASFTRVVHGERPIQYTGLDDDRDVAVALAFLGAARDAQILLAAPELIEEAGS